MINWTFNPNEFEKADFTLIPEGNHRVRIHDVVHKTFNSGNEGFEITLDVSGYGSKLWYYLVIDPGDSKKSNQRIGTFFESFNIGDFDLNHYANWKGKIGACRVKHEMFNDAQQAKVAFLLSREKQEKLPPWKGDNSDGYKATADPIDIQPNDLPFDM